MYTALIMAAGQSVRSGLGHNKNLHPLKGKPMILYSVERFLGDPECSEIIVVVNNDEKEEFLNVLPKKIRVAVGGDTRQESVLAGLRLVKEDVVMIHDGARPNLSRQALERLKEGLRFHSAAALAISASDTLKLVRDNFVFGDIDRESVKRLQTPQAFPTDRIMDAHRKARDNNRTYTDDVSVYQNETGLPIWLVEGELKNIKATTFEDIKILEALI
ncbi:MAG TPA: 2-C-methyl-D-erythritol 4-phosphate cytidylyltransferase [Bacillota bacterium]|nr:2-C-methyl-D-erythritol 4-phosphate cytidylyltransferase [Bacillota bacterium]HPF42070.1 2-C-methyl-D-erythritol 4-phosphate cytidylyltransferase [Bacillota bacterium]HPJ85792.1 2-C-methyl-D-erythritol 4-phosphate cytidylyltransferase [Bacillota bacterium]HPQ61517.1 2-C-methyl-D-erythritol 4-phosphate cytidylyltransferase [Bacillota bacterium]HRX92111.1 2-C-methyl-D-erythritol 4-phosphate cytidylyltransferase [Candidatus Izemoplasmatales bacterium]